MEFNIAIDTDAIAVICIAAVLVAALLRRRRNA